MLKKIMSFLIIPFVFSILTACSSVATIGDNSTNEQNTDSKIQVVVSFNAMREFTAAIGKDKVNITTIIPDGTEPHDYEPKVKDLQALSNAKIFIYNGFGMEAWVDTTLAAVGNKNLIVVEAAKDSKPIINSDKELVGNEGQFDPHIWLSLKGAEEEASNIKDALIKADPSDKAYFENNYADFQAKLEKLFNEYNDKFKNLQNKNFVTGHAAFAYLCRDFGLKQNSVEDVFADGEPSAKNLKELIDYCRENNIKTVFVENLVSPKVSDTLANEVGAKVEKIYTEESKEDNKDYLESMNYNLEVIYNSLK